MTLEELEFRVEEVARPTDLRRVDRPDCFAFWSDDWLLEVELRIDGSWRVDARPYVVHGSLEHGSILIAEVDELAIDHRRAAESWALEAGRDCVA